MLKWFVLSQGITPAYAGKSVLDFLRNQTTEDHPRVCGEKPPALLFLRPASGSPPRMRGKARLQRHPTAEAGITPAYAGKRKFLRNAHSVVGDHPRVCGEKLTITPKWSSTRGSPPRMRGKGRTGCPAPPRPRITPAYAGKRLKKSHSTVSPVAIVPLFPSVCNRPVVSNGNPAERDAPLFLPAENTVPASPAYNLRSS